MIQLECIYQGMRRFKVGRSVYRVELTGYETFAIYRELADANLRVGTVQASEYQTALNDYLEGN